jgi:hypothetical protein
VRTSADARTRFRDGLSAFAGSRLASQSKMRCNARRRCQATGRQQSCGNQPTVPICLPGGIQDEPISGRSSPTDRKFSILAIGYRPCQLSDCSCQRGRFILGGRSPEYADTAVDRNTRPIALSHNRIHVPTILSVPGLVGGFPDDCDKLRRVAWRPKIDGMASHLAYGAVLDQRLRPNKRHIDLSS